LPLHSDYNFTPTANVIFFTLEQLKGFANDNAPEHKRSASQNCDGGATDLQSFRDQRTAIASAFSKRVDHPTISKSRTNHPITAKSGDFDLEFFR
jgi:hypothetical protein